MKNRREFLKNAATGALMLGSQGKFGLASVLGQHAKADPSRLVVASDPALHAKDGRPDEQRVLDLLDRAMTAYTGRDHAV